MHGLVESRGGICGGQGFDIRCMTSDEKVKTTYVIGH